jgi:hypothetical protein
MAFKPLGMETVLESTEESRATLSKWKKGNRLVAQTTEENIYMQ